MTDRGRKKERKKKRNNAIACLASIGGFDRLLMHDRFHHADEHTGSVVVCGEMIPLNLDYYYSSICFSSFLFFSFLFSILR
ncbi:uncharacterized protein LY89DRAFT_489044 [Mollisia scopiformis]|uniref:Uncharacterized protein n=1 Tax=Mollisia scopiformis TaxID=149040 RepID=A0A194XGM9_MOLSC|nr:uncharacterized protein LY89DRAFT_489044 [Mollisia scopiformis]KUJ19355.1 hypothetical protein LY89DRAFT_489044 [Mollisia scopiformis]